MRTEAAGIDSLQLAVFLHIAAAGSNPARIAEDNAARIARIDHRSASPLTYLSAKNAIIDSLNPIAAAASSLLTTMLASIAAQRVMDIMIHIMALKDNLSLFNPHSIDHHVRKDPLHSLSILKASLLSIAALQHRLHARRRRPNLAVNVSGRADAA